MRHKYQTRGIILSRAHLGEASAYVTCITSELGLVRARAQGVRREGAKLAAALATFTESEIVLVRGKEVWRIGGTVLEENWFTRLPSANARACAARVAGLLERLVAGEVHETELFPIIRSFLGALAELSEESHEAAEILAVLRILAALGLDDGSVPSEFTAPVLATIAADRSSYIVRINRGIEASGL